MFTQIGLRNPQKQRIHVQTFLNEHIGHMEAVIFSWTEIETKTKIMNFRFTKTETKTKIIFKTKTK